MIKLKSLLGKRVLREQLNKLISEVTLIIEGRISDFRKKHRKVPSYIMDVFLEGDPSGVNKYLDWLGRVVTIKMNESPFSETDAGELMKWISIFHKKSRKVDIYSFKDLDSFIEYISKKNAEVGKREKVESEAELLFVNEYIRVVAPQTHEASQHFGGSTRWCLSTSNDGHWRQYYCEQGDSIVFVIFRKTGDKYAIVGDDPDYSSIYDKADHTLDIDARNELINKLQEEVNDDGENAWEAIDHFFSYDDRDTRRQDYEQEQLEQNFEEYGKRELDKDFKKIIAVEIDIDNDLIDDGWEEYIKSTFGNEYDRFLSVLWYGSVSRHGNEFAGTLSNLDDVYQYDEGNEFKGQVSSLIHIIKSDLIPELDLDMVVQNTLSSHAYESLYKYFYKEYTKAIKDVKTYLENTLNDPKQNMFSFGGKLKPNVKSFEELMRLMDKLGHTDIAVQILKYASGKYNKEHGQ